MKTIINTENIQTFIQQIPTITNNLQNISQTMKGFVDCLKHISECKVFRFEAFYVQK